MSEHTPGPWRFQDAEDKFGVIAEEAGVETLIVWAMSGNNIPANARLIAAAPDLLEVCEAVLAFLPLAGQAPIAGALADRLGAAIFKARGENRES